jgi:hypothetical protein
MVWNKIGVFFGIKYPDDTLIFHPFYRSLFLQEFINLVRYLGGILTKQQSFEE